jgi:S-adenosylmethionine-diacylgycerolhomoserine-N-methlytransferase
MSMASPAAGHAQLMDEVYRHQRYFYDFTRKYYLFGRDRLIGKLALAPRERVIEIGCGTARNLICMARRYPEAQFFGIDASEQMLDTARRQIAGAGLGSRISVAQGYAESLTPAHFGVPHFERAVFSYSLSMIPDWRGALAAALDSLAPQGRLHVVDFGDFAGLGSCGQAVMRAWLRHFHVEPRIAILSHLDAVFDSKGPALDGGLEILRGRYAFIFEGSSELLSQILAYVADATQPLEFPTVR